jgi:hypothetical protein
LQSMQESVASACGWFRHLMQSLYRLYFLIACLFFFS